MQEIDVKIKNKIITDSNIYIASDLKKGFGVNIECEARLKTPKDKNDKSVLLNFNLNLSSEDEKIKIIFVSDFIFEFDVLLDDYKDITEQKLIPMARNSLLDSLDEMLVIMGYEKMRLAEKFD